jgi:hypothetical protein
MFGVDGGNERRHGVVGVTLKLKIVQQPYNLGLQSKVFSLQPFNLVF